MKDYTISRQQFVDAFWKTEVEFSPSQIDEVMRILEQLPSAQPTHTTRSNTLDALDCINRQLVIDLVHLTILEFIDICADSEEVPITAKDKLLLEINKKIGTRIKVLPSAQPELIAQGAYVRGFEQGRTQGMIDVQGEPMSRLIDNTIKAEWTNADALDLQPTCNQLATDTISRQEAIDAIFSEPLYKSGMKKRDVDVVVPAIYEKIKSLPSAQPEPLTDKEQRIFLAAMGREEKVCEEVDRNHVREPYEDSLMSVCREIKRKVKGALWT